MYFASFVCCCSELHLATTWPHLTEGIVVDNEVYSDLDPLQAPHWSVRVRTAENPQCLLGDLLMEFFKLCCKKESTEEILGRRLAEDESKENSDISSALSKLTEPAATANSGGKAEQDKNSDYNLFLQLKSAPIDSLTYRLALCVCLVNYNHGGLRAVAHLWQEFVLELRYRWENNYLIYGLASGPPDLRCCLLHQKLQMLNCCIERKRARDEARKVLEGSRETEHKTSGSGQNSCPSPESATGTTTASTSAREVSPGKSWDSWSDSEEEFFECLSDQGEAALLSPLDEDLGHDRKQTVAQSAPLSSRPGDLYRHVQSSACFTQSLPQRPSVCWMREEFRLRGLSSIPSFF
ncbi:rab3 GTPase-activating protein catalytic subunit [Lates japonicus]|uniref:Rab3 GTPase-activating protein catalytic subunit n=1 Tax=Lates japonicus TaxID=270547 RepID=A0AAD3NAP6_LATJO|nr:rab3 GTPase-activating protein catalytic subunit [Lates japonicus]